MNQSLQDESIIFKFKKSCWTHVYLGLANKQDLTYLGARPK